MLEPPRGGSNEYPQSKFWSKKKKKKRKKKKKKKIGLTLQTPVSYRKVGFKGVLIARTCFPDAYFFKTFRQEAKIQNIIDASRHPNSTTLNTHKYGLLHIYEPSFFLSFLHVVYEMQIMKFI